MSLARAASARISLRRSNAETMDVFELELSFKVDETMEMIAAILVALS